ncbi:UDP-N-acetylglucosamine 2-epimerase [Rhizobacter sp. AJA081-3]|uniref:UDP-N-acetylglucosamine 2-epimerase n=1 Tax=Rhizobacter sp. AJA081-3 TaxID=2753607 RepID=UPI001AE0795F|nr:UDP-N-acetylglucosamine 2-epimerase [Rhizobacter sp. AJA081-3]QTN24602.1 UDP-N-acetylglucosamine 2-epimerase [Rhizobacter sp. AJA081-3]
MYETHFGISGPPFQLSPDPSFYFDSQGHHEALATLRRGLADPTGFVVVSGEIGAGKTTLVRTLLAELDSSRLVVGQVLTTQLDDTELMRSLVLSFGLPANADSPGALNEILQNFLATLTQDGRRAVLIVDEAQNLHRSAFDWLVQMEKGKVAGRAPLKICLVGQPELRDLVASGDLLALRERVSAQCHLGPLGLNETGAYIRHRLSKVGWSGVPSFEPGAFEEIHRWTGGIPRRINLLCNRLMLSRFLSSQVKIDVEAVAATAQDLRAEIGDTSAPPPPAAAAPPAAASPVATPAPSPAPALPVLREAVAPARPSAPIKVKAPAPAPAPAAVDVDLEVDIGEPLGAAQPALPPLRSGEESRPLLCVVGGQGEHVKAAALMHALAGRPELPVTLLVRCYANSAFERHRDMFAGLDVAGRLVSLGIAGGTYAGRAAELMKRFEFVVDHCQPAAVIVFDGSDAALSCGLVASRKGLPVLHVGAGLRSGSNADAADITRRLADQLSDVLYTAEPQANQQLAQEGVASERIQFVGNPLADALQIALRTKLPVANPRERLGLPANLLSDRNGYGVVILDAMPNVGDRQVLSELIAIMRAVAHDVPLVWPMHTRTREQLSRFKLDAIVASERIATLPSQSYPSLVQLMSNATCVITDSWNVQEEATVLSIPCLTIGLGQERATTVAVGSNLVVGRNKALATRAVWDCIFNGGKRGRLPELWDGHAATRIAEHMSGFLQARRSARSSVTA